MRTATAGLVLLVCQVCCFEARVQAKLLITPPEPPPEIAAKIAEAQTTAEVKPYLESAEESVRIAAVQRIAQIADTEAVPAIRDALWDEARCLGMRFPMVKQAMLRALAELATDEAKSVVADILKRYLRDGPRTERPIWRDGDYCGVVLAAVQALKRWHQDPEIHRSLRDIALRGRSDRFNSSMRQEAYQGLLLEDMRRKELTGRDKSAAYLIGKLTSRPGGHKHDWVQGKEGVMTLETIRNLAITNLLVGYGEPVVPYVHGELEALSPKEEGRKEALRNVLYLIDPEK